MNTLIIKLANYKDYQTARDIIKKNYESAKNTDWNFMQYYYLEDCMSFSCLALMKDGFVYPTSHDELPTNDTKVCNVDEMLDYFKYFKESTPEMSSQEVINALNEFIDSDNVLTCTTIHNNFNNSIDYIMNGNIAATRKGLLENILYDNCAKRENLLNFVPIIVNLITGNWNESKIYIKTFTESAYNKVNITDDKKSFSNEELLNVLKEFSFTEDHFKVNKLHCYLFDVLEKIYGEKTAEMYKIIIGVMLINSGNRRKNLLQFYPIFTLIFNKEWINLPE